MLTNGYIGPKLKLKQTNISNRNLSFYFIRPSFKTSILIIYQE